MRNGDLTMDVADQKQESTYLVVFALLAGFYYFLFRSFFFHDHEHLSHFHMHVTSLYPFLTFFF